MPAEFEVRVHFFRLSAALQPYFTALYAFDVSRPDSAVEDCLHPEWAAMRFTAGAPPAGCIGDGPIERKTGFVAGGPTSKALRFRLETAFIWGLGLQPAGWAKFADAAASSLADRLVDGSAEPAFSRFMPVFDIVLGAGADTQETAERINAYLMTLVDLPSPHEAKVNTCHTALLDPDIGTVAELGERVGLGARSLERLCGRYFGFPPKLLLRRQRFLRSLGKYMLSPDISWSEAIDGQYHDQSQFVRDFRSFMGMKPSEYADLPHPVLDRIIAQRLADQGAAPQTDLPTVLRYGKEPR